MGHPDVLGKNAAIRGLQQTVPTLGSPLLRLHPVRVRGCIHTV
jgi:hypothetical protein